MLSPTSVANIMNSVTPNQFISSGAMEAMYECASRFVEVIFQEAKQQYLKAGGSELTGDHFLQALGNMGLQDYYEYFDAYLRRNRENLNAGDENAQSDEPEPIAPAVIAEQGTDPVQPEAPGLPPLEIPGHLLLPITPPLPPQLLIPPQFQIQMPQIPIHPWIQQNLSHDFNINNFMQPFLLPEPLQQMPPPFPPPQMPPDMPLLFPGPPQQPPPFTSLQNAMNEASIRFHHYVNNFPLPLHHPHAVLFEHIAPMQFEAGMDVNHPIPINSEELEDALSQVIDEEDDEIGTSGHSKPE